MLKSKILNILSKTLFLLGVALLLIAFILQVVYDDTLSLYAKTGIIGCMMLIMGIAGVMSGGDL